MLGWASGKVEEFYPDEQTPTNKEEFVKLANSVYRDLEQWRSDKSEWVSIRHDTPDVELYERAMPGYDLPMFRIEGTLPASVSEVVKLIDTTNIEVKKRYDRLIDVYEVIEQVTDDICVIYAQYRAIFPVSNRDFTAMKVLKKLPDGTCVVFGQTINHKLKPRSNAFVRAKGIIGFYCFPVPGQPFQTKVLGLFLVSPMSYIPGWVINLVKSKSPNVLKVLSRILIEDYGKPALRRPLPDQVKKPEIRGVINIKEPNPNTIIVKNTQEIEEMKIMRSEVKEMIEQLNKSTFDITRRIQMIVEGRNRIKKGWINRTLYYFLLIGWPILVTFIYRYFFPQRGNNSEINMAKIRSRSN